MRLTTFTNRSDRYTISRQKIDISIWFYSTRLFWYWIVCNYKWKYQFLFFRNLICHYRFFLFSTGHNLTHSSILTAEMGLNCLCPFDHYKTTAENPSFIFRPWQENITLHHPPTKLISPKTTISSKLGTSSYSKQQKIK